MIRHIVTWNYGDGFTKEQNFEHARRIKQECEALADIVPGIVSLQIKISPLPGSDCDIVLNGEFASLEALQSYRKHEETLKIGQLFDAYLKERRCIDYYE